MDREMCIELTTTLARAMVQLVSIESVRPHLKIVASTKGE
jgi:hypothetical protein